MSNIDQIYDFIIERNIATDDEIALVTCIKGWNKTSLNDIIEVRTGYRSMDQLIECEGE